jgi:hypothetical protein
MLLACPARGMGVYLVVCHQNNNNPSSSKSSGAAWLALLQRANPRLKQLGVLMQMKHIPGGVVRMDDKKEEAQAR